MSYRVIGYAKELQVFFRDPQHQTESLYIEATGKKLLNILCTLEARRLLEDDAIDAVIVRPEVLTVTKEFIREG